MQAIQSNRPRRFTRSNRLRFRAEHRGDGMSFIRNIRRANKRRASKRTSVNSGFGKITTVSEKGGYRRTEIPMPEEMPYVEDRLDVSSFHGLTGVTLRDLADVKDQHALAEEHACCIVCAPIRVLRAMERRRRSAFAQFTRGYAEEVGLDDWQYHFIAITDFEACKAHYARHQSIVVELNARRKRSPSVSHFRRCQFST